MQESAKAQTKSLTADCSRVVLAYSWVNSHFHFRISGRSWPCWSMYCFVLLAACREDTVWRKLRENPDSVPDQSRHRSDGSGRDRSTPPYQRGLWLFLFPCRRHFVSIPRRCGVYLSFKMINFFIRHIKYHFRIFMKLTKRETKACASDMPLCFKKSQNCFIYFTLLHCNLFLSKSYK